jgi:hypothetical protein
MAQSALTVTPPNPTPPTNMGFTGATPPNPPNYTKATYGDPKNWSAVNPKDFPPPYYDDGSAGGLTQITSAQPALASGSADTAGGTGNPTGSTAGTAGTYPGAVNGTVPASTSVEGEGRGTEVVVTSPGSRAECPTQQVSVLGNRTTSPNQDHASTMSPAVNPALVSIAPTTLAAAPTGTQLITCTGTGFVPGCRIWHDNVEQTTTFVSATSITATVKKRPSAGVAPVVVKLGGVPMGVVANFTWT